MGRKSRAAEERWHICRVTVADGAGVGRATALSRSFSVPQHPPQANRRLGDAFCCEATPYVRRTQRPRCHIWKTARTTRRRLNNLAGNRHALSTHRKRRKYLNNKAIKKHKGNKKTRDLEKIAFTNNRSRTISSTYSVCQAQKKNNNSWTMV